MRNYNSVNPVLRPYRTWPEGRGGREVGWQARAFTNNLLYPFVPAAREMHARSCEHTLPIGLINDAINLIIELQTSAPGDDDVARYNCLVVRNGACRPIGEIRH